MKFGIGLNPQNNIPYISKLSQIAEDAGFEYLWLCDYPNIDIYQYLNEIAKSTETIKFGHGTTNAYIKKPENIISEINDLSNNRSILGLSVGSKSQTDQLNIPWEDPITKLKQTINIVNENCYGVPIYIEAQSKNIIETFEKNSHGFLITASHPKDFEELKVKLKSEICAYTATSIGYDLEEVKNASKIVVSFIIAGSPPHILKRHGTSQKIYENIKLSLSKGDIASAMQYVNDDLINQYSVCGTPYDIIERINDLKDNGVRQFIVSYPISQDCETSLKLFKDVISTF